MSEKGILYTPPNIKLVVAGTKTQTRRLPTSFAEINKSPDEWEFVEINSMGAWFRRKGGKVEQLVKLPYNIGDRLYIKEGIILDSKDSYYKADHMSIPSKLIDEHSEWIANHWGENKTFVSPLFMPKWCARHWQRVTGVNVERLNDISEEDAKAEGVTCPPSIASDRYWPTYKDGYAEEWDSLYGQGAWEANPWLPAYTVEMEE